MKELVILSGKGGTGKTSLCAAFAALARRDSAAGTLGKAVFADVDVDAADLHLVLDPTMRDRSDFIAGKVARIDAGRCLSCGRCASLCRFDAVRRDASGTYRIESCEGCGVCVRACPAGAVSFTDRLCGEWYRSDTRFGPLIHARLYPGAENSGKLVTLVRAQAKGEAEATGAEFILTDGCPGIGCPVIASMTGADAVLAVAEPSLSGLHDLRRLAELAGHFKVPVLVAVNKFDINGELAREIKAACPSMGARFLGAVPYDPAVTRAQVAGLSVLEYDGASASAKKIEELWNKIREELWKR